jgi:type VI secretion system protein ImpI
MILTLEVLPPQAAALGDGGRRVFSAHGGTIGRASSCDWVLSHRKVSGRHATISFQDGVFYIVDEQSANGVFINSAKNRLVPGRRYALKDGDRIIIDPYEMEVSIGADRGHDARRPFDEPVDARGRSQGGQYNPFDSVDPFGPPLRTPTPLGTPPSTPRPRPAGEVVPLEELDPLKLLEGKPKPPARQAPSARDLENASPMAGHYQPPAVLTPPPGPPNAIVIPPDYDPLKDDSDESFDIPPPSPPTPRPAPPTPRPAAPTPPPRAATPAPRPAPPPPPDVASAPIEAVAAIPPSEAVEPRTDSGLLEVLAGAGLHHAPVTLEFARSFGQIFRVVVSGVMDVLRARQQIKDEFRMRLTQFRPADNNPLKFSANVDDALHNLLVKRNAAYLEPVEAFEDAFDDLRDHQMAVLAGMRVAFEAMLSQFDPDRLQDEFDRTVKRSALLGVTARLRYWDLYREQYEAMAKDPEATFRRLFGEEFAKAYEEQLRRLKAERRDRDSGPRPPEA